MTQSTTLPVTAKVVRECATKTLTYQRKLLDELLRKLVEKQNAAAHRHNWSFWATNFNLKFRDVVDVETTIETWKQQWLNGEIDGDHPAYDLLWISRTSWWKRLRQLEQLPTADDEKIMQVSVEDLNLFDYNTWMKP